MPALCLRGWALDVAKRMDPMKRCNMSPQSPGRARRRPHRALAAAGLALLALAAIAGRPAAADPPVVPGQELVTGIQAKKPPGTP